jgi:hypothetical protein
MRGNPHFQVEPDLICKYPDQFGRPAGNLDLATADPNARPQGSELCNIIIASETELLSRERLNFPSN